jgi:hypothetical protein
LAGFTNATDSSLLEVMLEAEAAGANGGGLLLAA